MNQPLRITIDQPNAVTMATPGAAPEAGLRRVSAFDLVAATPWAIEPGMLETKIGRAHV